MTSIGYCAFESCYRLVEVINNSSLNIIKGSEENGYAGYYAIEIHRGSSKILNSGDYIFYAYYTNNNWVYSLVDYVGESDTLVLPDNCNGSKYRINQYAFVFRDDIKSIRITENVGGIGTSAFYYCSNLEEFYFNAPSVSNLSYSVFSETGKDIKAVIGKNVIKLPPFLFYNSTVSSVEFEEGSICNSIGESSFKNCKKLTEIELPDTVSSIGVSAFSGCVNLASINIPENVSAIEYQTFASCSSITELDLPSNITKIGVGAFAGCSSLVKVKLPDNLKTIGEQAFYNCTALKSVNIPEKVTKISYLAFGNCRALEEIYFAATALGDLNSGDYAFNYAGSKSNTLKVTVANNVTVIPKYLFYASYVKTVEFEEGSVCTAIKDYAFYGTKLTEIVIPDSIQKIGANAFYNCSTLSTVNYTGTKEQWNAITKGSSWDYNTGDYTVIYDYSK